MLSMVYVNINFFFTNIVLFSNVASLHYWKEYTLWDLMPLPEFKKLLYLPYLLIRKHKPVAFYIPVFSWDAVFKLLEKCSQTTEYDCTISIWNW